MIFLTCLMDIADIQDYFEFIIKKHETLTENPPVQIYPNKIKNRIQIEIIISRNDETIREHKKKIKMEKMYQN